MILAQLERQLHGTDVCPRVVTREDSHPDALLTQVLEGRPAGVAIDQDAVTGDQAGIVLAEVLDALLELLEVRVLLRRLRGLGLQQEVQVVLALRAPRIGIKRAVECRVVTALGPDPVRSRVVVEAVGGHVDDLDVQRLATPLDLQRFPDAMRRWQPP